MFRPCPDRESKYLEEKVYTYCATCKCMIRPKVIDISHVLTRILGVEENEKMGNSLINRMKFKFK